MKKTITALLRRAALLTLTLSCLPSAVFAAPNTHLPNAWSPPFLPNSVPNAIAVASSGDIVKIELTGDSADLGSISIGGKDLQIIGPGADQMTMRFVGSLNIGGGSDVTIEDMSLSFTSGVFFSVESGSKLTLKNCHVIRWWGGIEVSNSEFEAINCTFGTPGLATGGIRFIDLGGGNRTHNLVNCTFAGNLTSDAVLVNRGHTVNLTHCTFTGNNNMNSNLSSGIKNDLSGPLGMVNVRNCVFENNDAIGFDDNASFGGIPNSITSLGGNVIEDTSLAAFIAMPSDLMSVGAPILNPALADNGGSVPTHALAPASVALDKGVGAGIAIDARKQMRDAMADSGAHEGIGATVTIPAPVINEVLSNPNAADANGDSTGDNSQDEFVEIVNRDDAGVTLDGWKISVAGVVKHVFSSTTLAVGEGVTVFGGGSPSGSISGVKQPASTGNLALTDLAGVVRLLDPNDNVIDCVYYTGIYGGAAQPGISLHRDPELTGQFEPHTLIAGAMGIFPRAPRRPGSVMVCRTFPRSMLKAMACPSQTAMQRPMRPMTRISVWPKLREARRNAHSRSRTPARGL